MLAGAHMRAIIIAALIFAAPTTTPAKEGDAACMWSKLPAQAQSLSAQMYSRNLQPFGGWRWAGQREDEYAAVEACRPDLSEAQRADAHKALWLYAMETGAQTGLTNSGASTKGSLENIWRAIPPDHLRQLRTTSAVSQTLSESHPAAESFLNAVNKASGVPDTEAELTPQQTDDLANANIYFTARLMREASEQAF
jgi:hypothetical protein